MSSAAAHPLIDSLQNPGVWPHRADEVQLLETHISWVLLAGEFAYKIKKPVDFGFVDFSTLERRRFFCEEELRLNRRLAADLYLDVVPFCGTEAEPQVGGNGEPIEYAVKMRRFPQEWLLSRLIERGELTQRHVDLLADELARFHSRIATADVASTGFGSLQAVQQPVAENFRHLQQAAVDGDWRGQIAALREWSTQEFQRCEAEFTRRRDGGFIRECHGDVHLGNVIAERRTGGDDRIVIFDCIEFNERFRWIDVMSEAAFVVMDFADRGRADFSRRFFNAYLERTGDYAGMRVLRYYLVYRALVRAKVASLRGTQDELDEAERQSLRQELRQYVELAAEYVKPQPTPLIITHGFSGSGKSTGTQPLIEQRGCLRLRSDVERQRMFAQGADSSSIDGGIYTPEHTARTYDRLAELARDVIESGFPVVVDATFLKRPQRDQFRRLAGTLGVAFLIADFDVPEAELRRRIRQRQAEGGDASEADLSVLDQQLQTHDPLGEDEQAFVFSIDDEAQ